MEILKTDVEENENVSTSRRQFVNINTSTTMTTNNVDVGRAPIDPGRT